MAGSLSYTPLAQEGALNERASDADDAWLSRWSPLRHKGKKTLGFMAAPVVSLGLSACVVASLVLQVVGWGLATATFLVTARGHGGPSKHFELDQELRKPNFWDMNHVFKGSSSKLLLVLFETAGAALPVLRAALSLAALWLPRPKIRDACLLLLEAFVAKLCLAQIFVGGLLMIVVAVRFKVPALDISGRDSFVCGPGQQA